MASSTAQKAWEQAEQLTQSRYKRDSAFERSLFGETGSILAQSPLRDTVFKLIATHRDNNLHTAYSVSAEGSKNTVMKALYKPLKHRQNFPI